MALTIMRSGIAVLLMAGVFLLHAGSSAQDQAITYSGSAFVDAAVANDPQVEVRAGDNVCSEQLTPIPAPADAPVEGNRYLVRIVTDDVNAACPAVGEQLTFVVDGRVANQSPVLTPGANILHLSVGPQVAVFSGRIDGDQPPAGASVVAQVGGVPCGEISVSPASQFGPAEYRNLIVASTCATEGARVVLLIDGLPAGQANWSPGVYFQDLRFALAKPSLIAPETGSAGCRGAVPAAGC